MNKHTDLNMPKDISTTHPMEKTGNADTGKMKAAPGMVVLMEYKVRLATGKVVDSSEKSGGPVAIICGKGDFPPPVEEAIVGLGPGDQRVVTVPPEYAYGVYDPKKQVLVASERISGEVDVGKVIKAPDEFGIKRPAIVRSIMDGALMVDFNHPLSGQILKFEILIKDVQPAPEGDEAEYKAPEKPASVTQ